MPLIRKAGGIVTDEVVSPVMQQLFRAIKNHACGTKFATKKIRQVI